MTRREQKMIARAAHLIAEVIAEGEAKHGKTWLKADLDRFLLAGLDHTVARLRGGASAKDAESGHSPLAHAGARIIMALARDLDGK